MQIGEGEGDAGTSWLERAGGTPISRHTNADNDQHGAHDWNVTVVYWKTTYGWGLDNPNLPPPQERVEEETKSDVGAMESAVAVEQAVVEPEARSAAGEESAQ